LKYAAMQVLSKEALKAVLIIASLVKAAITTLGNFSPLFKSITDTGFLSKA